MEIILRRDPMNLKDFFLKEARPFTSKRDVNWIKVKMVSSFLIFFIITGILIFPSSAPEQTNFYEKSSSTGENIISSEFIDPNEDSLRQLEEARMTSQHVHSSLDHLYKQDAPRGSGGTSQTNRNSGMVLSRNGFDGRTQLSPGTRIPIRLSNGVSVSDQSIPITGIVIKDIEADSGVAIPSGSKVIGEVSFESSNERTNITWHSIILPDGRERPFTATGVGRNGEGGLEAKVRTESLKNAFGQTLTKFVGAYAEGSINTGAFGASPGGSKNGLRNAIAETATDRANAMGETLQKERKWAELKSGQEIFAILNQPFSFREPGSLNGQ